MAKIIWSSFPSNHSGYLNLLYLGPDGEIGVQCGHTSLDGDEYCIMGGPALQNERGVTAAGRKLLSFLDNGFFFFPKKSEAEIRDLIKGWRTSGNRERIHWEVDVDVVTDTGLNDHECVRLLHEGQRPDGVVAFVSGFSSGMGELCMLLASIFFGLPQKKRQERGFKQDWSLPYEG